MSLTFQTLRDANLKRALLWHKDGLEEWSVSDWAVAFMGEAGKLCDAIKKMNRIRDGLLSMNPRQPTDMLVSKFAIAEEIGDSLIYLDLLCARLNFSLEDCVVSTFNRISEREGFAITL